MNQPKLKRGDLRDALIEYAHAQTRAGNIEIMSLRQAARDLGVSSGAVYRHFADKEALHMELVFQSIEEIRHRFHTIRPEGSKAKDLPQLLERCRSLVYTYITYAHENATLWRLNFGRIGTLCKKCLMEDPAHMCYTPFDVTRFCLEELHELGAIPTKPNIQDMRYVWSATHGAADLVQSGTRLDADQVDMICEETHIRNLRSLGYQI